MTAFTSTNLPSTINTVEELMAWAACALAEINPNQLVAVSSAALEPAVQVQTFRFANQETSPERLVVIAYLPLVTNWRSQGKLWSNGVAELSSAALPAGFTQP